MLLILQARSPVPATELAARLEVSVRTIYRDVEAMSAAGIPVYAERGRSGGIALLAGYRTQVPGLSADETRSLFVALTGASHADLGLGDALGSALRKVLASLPGPQRDTAALIAERILVDPSRWGAEPVRPEHLDTVQGAVLDGRRLRIHYPGRYLVDPLGLVAKAGVWYLVAEHRRVIKSFRVDRISRATVLDEPARRRAGFQLAETWARIQRDFTATRQAVAVRVRVHRSVLLRVLRMHGDDTGPPIGDGDEWTEVTLRFPVLEAAQALLAHADRLEILDPPELRDRFAELARRTAAVYEVATPGTGS